GGISSDAYHGARLMVNIYDPGATSATNATPIVLPGDGSELYLAGSGFTTPDLHVPWALDAGFGMAVVVFGVNTSAGPRMAAQRIRADGTLIDASPVPLSSTSLDAALTHGTQHYFAQLSSCYHTGCYYSGLELDPAASDFNPVSLPAETPRPYGPPVRGRLAA